MRKLFTDAAVQPKAAKGEAQGYSTIVLHLAPHRLSGRGNVCKWASPECRDACLNTAGRGGILAGTDADITAGRTNTIQAARVERTRLFFDLGADAFTAALIKEIGAHVRKCARNGKRPAVRLNGTSDIPWERVAPDLFKAFPDVVFYDYTKAPVTARPDSALPANYSLTMSYSGHNLAECLSALSVGRNVAVVFAVRKGRALPPTWNGFPVVDGDVTDLRFLDPRAVVVGLRAKGRARKQETPFIVRAA